MEIFAVQKNLQQYRIQIASFRRWHNDDTRLKIYLQVIDLLQDLYFCSQTPK